MTLEIAYTDQYLKYKLGAGDGSHMTRPIRAKIATELLVRSLGSDVRVIEPTPTAADRERIESVHSADYVSRVLDKYRAADWVGANPDNADAALHMFAGTVRLTENILAGTNLVGFNPQGAKHHAAYAKSEGFCVFNDMVWAAQEFKAAGMKPLYLDWDVHAGDGVQNLLAATDIPTLSIHGSGIYPFGMGNHSKDVKTFGTTHEWHNEQEHWYNWNLEVGSGDEELSNALDSVGDVIDMYKPDVILLAAGADGHEEEYWGLQYTMDGFIEAGDRVSDWAKKYTEGRVLIGGAGGYNAETYTPHIWANVVETIYTGIYL